MHHDELIKKMTLAEKCAMLSGKDVWHTRPIERLGVASIALSDGPSGLRKQEGEGDQLGLNASTLATCVPSAATVANSWDMEVARQAGSVIGSEAAAQNVQVLLGPGLNTKRNPLCGRNFEYFSEDPYLSGKMAAAFIQGVQSHGISACAKHFAANSQELRRMHNDSQVDERTLRELYLTNFEIAVKEGKPHTIMTSYNRVNGVYTNENPHLVEEILRGEWGYDGAVVTDWGGSNDYTEGARAGMNLEMPGCGDDSPIQLMNAVKEGRIAESIVDQRVDELLDLIDVTTAVKNHPAADMEANHAAASKAAEASIVLLKNEGGILPLKKDTKVAFIGDFVTSPRYQGAGSSMVNAYKIDKTSDMAASYFSDIVGIAQGYERLDMPNEELSSTAVELAKKADVVLMYMGLTESFETEGLDRTHMRIPQNQITLLSKVKSVCDKVVVVLSAGSAVEMPWLDNCTALVYGGLGGQAGAGAMLRVLTGEVCPSGKLAETFAIKLEDMPSSKYYPGDEITSEYREGLYVGYRATETAGTLVNFPFGYGLSYTTFSYDKLTVTDKGVSFEITNTGKCTGAEVAQLYISLPGSKVFRPIRELKGFAKVELKPGETKTVSIAFDDKSFRYFNVKTNRFEIEGGTYTIAVGASVSDIRLTGSLEVKGTDAPLPYEGIDISCYENCTVLGGVPDAQYAAILGRPIPVHTWNRDVPMGMNDTFSQLFYAKNPIGRLVGKIMKDNIDKSIAKGKPDLNSLFIYNMPFRGVAKMMNGMVSMEMSEALLFMFNGHGFRGLGRLIKGFFNRPSLDKLKDK